MDSYIAAVTFNHLAIFPKGRDTIRTCHCAAVTANTVSGIVTVRLVSGSLRRQALGQAVMQGASLQCMQAKDRWLYFTSPFLLHFQVKYISERSLPFFYLKSF